MTCKHGNSMYCVWCEDQAAIADLADECKTLRAKLLGITGDRQRRISMGSPLDLDDLVSSYETARNELAALRKNSGRYLYFRKHYASVGMGGVDLIWDQPDPGGALDVLVDYEMLHRPDVESKGNAAVAAESERQKAEFDRKLLAAHLD